MVALKLWSRYFKSCHAKLQIRGDSVTALTLALKLSSSSAKLNSLGAEIALELEIMDISDVVAAHSPGKLLVVADYLSRLHEPGADVAAVPPELTSAKRRTVQVRDASFFRVWSISS